MQILFRCCKPNSPNQFFTKSTFDFFKGNLLVFGLNIDLKLKTFACGFWQSVFSVEITQEVIAIWEFRLFIFLNFTLRSISSMAVYRQTILLEISLSCHVAFVQLNLKCHNLKFP